MSSELPPGLFPDPRQASIPGVPAPIVATVIEGKKPRAVRGSKKATNALAASAAAGITPERSAALEAQRDKFSRLLAVLQQAPTETQEQCQDLVDTAADIKNQLDGLTAEKKAIVDPINAAASAVRRFFDPPIKFLESCESAIKGKLEARLNGQRQVQAQALAQVTQANGAVSSQTMALATGAENVIAPEGSYEVEDWDCEITDATQLPAAYWIPNMDLLRATAKQQKNQAAVPGVRFFASRSLRVRRNS